MLRFFFLTLFIIFLSNPAFSQQDPLFSTYTFNRLWHNPAYAGAEEKKTFTLISRGQWQVNEYPLTFMLSYDQPFKKTSNSSIGAALMHDRIGPLNSSQIGIGYAYKLKISEDASLRIGAQVSLFNQKMNGALYHVADPNDPIFIALSKGGEDTKFDADLGAWFSHSKFYAGISVKHITEAHFNYSSYKRPLYRHFYFIAGTDMNINSNLKMSPSIIGRLTTGASAQVVEITDIFYLKNKYIFGGSFRLDPSFGGSSNANPFIIITGINLSDKLQFIISHDLPNSALGYAIEGNIKVKI